MSAPAILCHTWPPAKRKQWSNRQMEEAMKAVHKGDTGINQAAREYGIPRTTLKDRVSGRVKHDTKSGPQPYLSVDEETELAKFVKQCAEVGCGKTRKDVMHIAQSVARELDC